MTARANSTHEEKLTTLEEKATNALEMAAKAHEKREAQASSTIFILIIVGIY